jgi:putative ABC transport system substrate-binding protein
MRRRQFITLLGSAVAWSIAARAQQQAVPLIGYLSTGWAADGVPKFAAGFQRGLKDIGLAEGRDYAIEYRSPDGQNIDCRRALPIWWLAGSR